MSFSKATSLYTSLVILILIILTGYFSLYGLSYPPCGQREREAILPSGLNGIELKFKEAVRYGVGEDSINCTKSYNEIRRQVIYTDGMGLTKYWQDRGLTLEKVPIGTTFKIKGAMDLRLFGLNGIDMGNDWRDGYYVIVDDQNRESIINSLDLKESTNIDPKLINF